VQDLLSDVIHNLTW